MKKITMLLTAVALMSGLSLCYAGGLENAGSASAVSCQGGVCEIGPGPAGAGRADVSLAAPASAADDIIAVWEKEAKPGPHDVFVANTAEPQTGVLFAAKRPVKDFRVLALEFKEISSDGKPVFQIKELYTKDFLMPERPLLVKTTFFGSIPNNGISFTDTNGKTRYFSVSQSGMDGSVELGEF